MYNHKFEIWFFDTNYDESKYDWQNDIQYNDPYAVKLIKVGLPDEMTFEYQDLNGTPFKPYTVGLWVYSRFEHIIIASNNRLKNKDSNNYYKFVTSGIALLLLYGTVFPSKRDYHSYGLFEGCENIVKADRLAIDFDEFEDSTGWKFGQANMFRNCKNLVIGPSMSGSSTSAAGFINISDFGMANMFAGCTSLLDTPPVVFSGTVGRSSFASMFQGCTSLTGASLPVKRHNNSTRPYTFSPYCFSNMFNNCFSLKNITINVGGNSYFKEGCCKSMLMDCKNLTGITVQGFSSWNEEEHIFDNWVKGVKTMGLLLPSYNNLPKIYDLNHIPVGWNRQTKTVKIKSIPDMLFGDVISSVNFSNYFNNTTNTKIVFDSLPSGFSSNNYMLYYNPSLLVEPVDTTINIFVIRPNRSLINPTYRPVMLTGFNLRSNDNPITFEAKNTNSTIKIVNNNPDDLSGFDMLYRLNDLPWTKYNIDQVINLGTSNKVSFRNKRNDILNALGQVFNFEGTGSVDVYGSIRSLYNYDNNNYRYNNFQGLFKGNEAIENASGLILPDRRYNVCKEMFKDCSHLISIPNKITTRRSMVDPFEFEEMFYGCSNLVTVPKNLLPQLEVRDGGYKGMFMNCHSLTEAPDLPATSLRNACYQEMFLNCQSLTAVPSALAALDLNPNCYLNMFAFCYSLSTAPALPATGLATECYKLMFDRCISLTSAPALPATELANSCYYRMFNGCSSLIEAPLLPATTLSASCYCLMFNGCSSLTEAPDLPATELANSCYYGMFLDCSNLSSINVSFTRWEHLQQDYTEYWLLDVAESGIFYKPSDLPEEYGAHRIPSGWIVINNDYLTFKAVSEEANITFKKGLDTTFKYSLNNGSWLEYQDQQVINLNQNDTVKFFGENNQDINPGFNWNHQFQITGLVESFGNIHSLTNFDTQYVGFYNLFRGCSGLLTAPSLPALDLKSNCYKSMFLGCISLTEAPSLPATGLADSCYYNMFRTCSNLSSINVSFTDWNSDPYITQLWVQGVAESGIFYKPSNLPEEYGYNKIPKYWLVVNK